MFRGADGRVDVYIRYLTIQLGGGEWQNTKQIEKKNYSPRTSITGSSPFTPTFKCSFPISTVRSRPRRFPATGTVMSTSAIVCVHLYGNSACSAASLVRAAASCCSRSEGVGDVDIVATRGYRFWRGLVVCFSDRTEVGYVRLL